MRHQSWHYRTNPRTQMKFLFQVTILFYSTPVFYQVFKIDEQMYSAIPTDKNMRSFKLKKESGHWISEGGYTQHIAEELGKEIDRKLS